MPRPRSKPWPPEPNQTASGKPGAIQLGDADDLCRKSGMQAGAAARTRLGTTRDDCIGIIAQHPAVTLVRGLAPLGLECARCSLRSVTGGLDEVREVLSGCCSHSTTLS